MTCLIHPSLPYVETLEYPTAWNGIAMREIRITLPDSTYRFLTHTHDNAINPYDRLRVLLHEALEPTAPPYLRTQVPLLRRAVEELHLLFPYGNRSVRDALWTLSRHADTLPSCRRWDWELAAIAVLLAILFYTSGAS